MKKIIYAAGLALCLSLASISSTAIASEGLDVPKNAVKQILETEHPTPYSQITTYSNGSASGVDFSEATFYDEAGNVIEPPMDSDTDLVTPLASGTSEGTWSNGSGYSCVKKVKVLAWYAYPSIEMGFYADFCINSGATAYDTISDVYLPIMSFPNWENLTRQLTKTETLDSPASGGYSAKVKRTASSNYTLEHVYLKVQKDSYKVETSFK